MSNLFNSEKVTKVPPVRERAANSAINCNLLFVKICLAIFPFDVWDRLWVLNFFTYLIFKAFRNNYQKIVTILYAMKFHETSNVMLREHISA